MTRAFVPPRLAIGIVPLDVRDEERGDVSDRGGSRPGFGIAAKGGARERVEHRARAKRRARGARGGAQNFRRRRSTFGRGVVRLLVDRGEDRFHRGGVAHARHDAGERLRRRRDVFRAGSLDER